MKRIIIIGLVALLGVLGYFVYQNFADTKSAKEVAPELLAHFQKSGISVKLYASTQEEIAYVENLAITDAELKKAGVSPKDISDSFGLKFDAIKSPVKISVYKKTADAKSEYAKLLETEATLRKLHEKNNREHRTKDYYINGNLLMEIRYYETYINSYGNAATKPIDIEQSELNKIVAAFKSYK